MKQNQNPQKAKQKKQNMINAKSKYLRFSLVFGFTLKIIDDVLGVAVVVVTFIRKIREYFSLFFGMCVFPKKINNPFGWSQ